MFRWIKNKAKAIFSRFKKKENNTLYITDVNQSTKTITVSSSPYASNNSAYILPSYYGAGNITNTTNNTIYNPGFSSGTGIWTTNTYQPVRLTNLELEQNSLQTMGLGPKQGYFDKDNNFHYFDNYMSSFYSLYNNMFINPGYTTSLSSSSSAGSVITYSGTTNPVIISPQQYTQLHSIGYVGSIMGPGNFNIIEDDNGNKS